ncbi:MAG: Rib/alpha-like domain-containing protein, partial [Peptoniphilaceae bacterium]|nr:Rib/alpha-like domain-containing protein [Peptoniphilaceae bacterium]
GKIKVTPPANVDGPITLTVKDDDFDADKVYEVPVTGHEKNKDDNGSDKPEDNTPPTITPIDDKTVVEGVEITPIPVTTDDPTAIVTVEGLPDGLTYNKETGQIEGVPTKKDDWGNDEEKEIKVTVKAKDENNNESTPVEFTITLQRDTDGDKDPDVTDKDDDNDGSSDEEEKKYGTDPKDKDDKPSDSDKYNPEGKEITVEKDDTPEAKDGIKNKEDLPDGTKYEFEGKVDTTTPGEKEVTVIVTYPDGSQDRVTTTVKVNSDADNFDPEGKDVEVETGKDVKPEDAIANKDDLPEGTKFEWQTPVDTTKVGEQEAVVVVTYPDGSKDYVTVKVNVVEAKEDESKDNKGEEKKAEENPKTGVLSITGLLGAIAAAASELVKRRKDK